MTIKFGPGTIIAGFQHPGGGGGGGGGNSFTTPATSAFSPFGAGNSMFFNGGTMGIAQDATPLDIIGNDWTVEGFWNEVETNAFPRLFAVGNGSDLIGISLEGGTMYFWMNGGVAGSYTKPTAGNWHHFAMVGNTSGGVTMYVDGNAVASGGFTTPNLSGQILTIGNQFTTADTLTSYGGYMQNLRWTVGVQVYTGDFTVPTSALQLTQSAGANISAITSGQVKYLMSV